MPNSFTVGASFRAPLKTVILLLLFGKGAYRRTVVRTASMTPSVKLIVSRVAILLLTVALYSNAFHSELHFDEVSSIPFSQNWADSVSRDHIPGTLQWRPVSTGALAIQGRIFGTNGSGYRVVSTALHAGNALLLLETALAWGFPAPAAIAAGLVFAAHPAATEPVNWLVAQSELWALLFLLLALLIASPRYADSGRTMVIIASSGAILCAILSKEQAAAGAAVVVLLGLAAPAATPEIRRTCWWVAGAWCAMVALFLALRMLTVGWALAAGLAEFAANPLAALPFHERILNAGHILWTYLARLAVPYPLVALYGYPDFTAYPLASWQSFTGLLALGLFPLAAWGVLKHPHPLWIAAGGILALLFPVSNILIPIGAVFGDRLLYGPAAFFALGAGWILFHRSSLEDFSWRKQVAVPVAAGTALLISYSALTHARNPDWATACRRFETAVHHVPDSVMVLTNLAACAAQEGAIGLAKERIRHALKVLPDYPAGLFLAAKLYTVDEEFSVADELWQEAIASKRRAVQTTKGSGGDFDWIYFENIRAMQDMGASQYARLAAGRWITETPRPAVEFVRAAARLRSRYGDKAVDVALSELVEQSARSSEALTAAGDYYMEQESPELVRLGEALLEEAAEADPGNIHARATLALHALLRNQFDTAETYLNGCLAADPDHIPCLVLMSRVWLKKGYRSRARPLIEKLKSLGAEVPRQIQLEAQGSDFGQAILDSRGKPAPAPNQGP